MGKIIELVTALFPPTHPDPVQNQWQRTISVYVMLIGGSVMLNIMLTWGMLPVLFGGFAAKVEAQDVQHLVKEIRIEQLENALRNYRIRQCQAQMEGNQAALDAASSNLREKGNVYWQLTQRVYVPETCDALLVARR